MNVYSADATGSVDCTHNRVLAHDEGWTCANAECDEEFAPVAAFEAQMEQTLAAMAWVIDKIAKMNGIADEVVDNRIAAVSAVDGSGEKGPRTYVAGDGHTHQYNSDMQQCILCAAPFFIGGE